MGGRDRFRREYFPRVEARNPFGRNDVPPSRHLWVGNLSPHITESLLSEQFLRFGELDGIAFYPGRSYAFVNFKKDEDAAIAMRGLQGFVVAGFPLKIEFTKGVSCVDLHFDCLSSFVGYFCTSDCLLIYLNAFGIGNLKFIASRKLETAKENDHKRSLHTSQNS